jgi:hypothetical protein
MTYESAKEMLRKARKGSKTLCHMTTLRKVEAGYAIRYHNTDVVTIHEDNSYTLNSGGWYTPTTKDRINEYSPARIHQEKGLWYHKNGFMFADKCKVDDSGFPLDSTLAMTLATEKAKGKVDRMVSKYIKGFMTMLLETKVMPTPDTGDCWGCLFVDTEGKTDVMGYDHLLSHFTDKYYVPSLLANAVNEHYQDNPGFIWHLIKNDVEKGRDSYHARNALMFYFRKRKLELVKLLLESCELKAAG